MLPALEPWRVVVGAALVVLVLLWANYATTVHWPLFAGVDNYAYWSAWQDGLYAPDAQLAQATYVYSPAFAQLLWPFTLLPWDAFRVLWIVAACASMVWLLWPLGGLLRWEAIALACYFCLNAKADWIVALGAAIGFRYPGAWAAIVLTKVTPGVGLLWFALRREWKALGWAIGTTAALVAVSILIAPHLWPDWFGVLLRSTAHSSHGDFMGNAVPSIYLRLLLAGVLVAWGAIRGRTWVLPVAALLAVPDLWVETLVILAAIPRISPRPVGLPRGLGRDA